MNKFVKIKECNTGRYIYINTDKIIMIFSLDEDPNKTIIICDLKTDNPLFRRYGDGYCLITEGSADDIFDAITDSYREDQFE